MREPYQEAQPDRWFVIIAEICTFFTFFGWHEIIILSGYKFWWSLISAAVVVFMIQASFIFLRRLFPMILIAWLLALLPFIYFLIILLRSADDYHYGPFTRMEPFFNILGFGKAAIPLFAAGAVLQLAALSMLIYRRKTAALRRSRA